MSTLAASNYIEGKLRACRNCVAGFFYACALLICAAPTGNAQGPVPPCKPVMGLQLPSSSLTTGKAGPFYCSRPQLNTLKMSNTEQKQDLATLAQALGITGANKIQITYKVNKVSVGCRLNGFSYGASAPTLNGCLLSLIENVHTYQHKPADEPEPG